MKVYRSLELKWYHILIGAIGLGAVIGVLLYFFLGRNRLAYFAEDETDIVS